MTDFFDGKADLEAVLAEAVRALSMLDAGAIEALAAFLEGNPEWVRLPRCPGDWERLRSRQWILGHLLDGTLQRLEMLRRVASPPRRFGAYGGRALDGASFQDASVAGLSGRCQRLPVSSN